MKNNVRNDGAVRGFKPVYHLRVYKDSIAGAENIPVSAHQKISHALLYINKFDLRVPVPVDTVKVEIPDVLIIVAEGIFFAAVTCSFTQGFIRYYPVLLISSLIFSPDLRYCVIKM